MSAYGFCPQCGAEGVQRERRPNGDDKCAKGHKYPSKSAIYKERVVSGIKTPFLERFLKRI